MTPDQPPGTPTCVEIALARREHALLNKQRDATAEAIVQLSDALSTLGPSRGVTAETATNPIEQLLGRACFALSTLMEIRLLELQMMHESYIARVDELEVTLTMADGGDLAALSRATPQASEYAANDREKHATA